MHDEPRRKLCGTLAIRLHRLWLMYRTMKVEGPALDIFVPALLTIVAIVPACWALDQACGGSSRAVFDYADIVSVITHTCSWLFVCLFACLKIKLTIDSRIATSLGNKLLLQESCIATSRPKYVHIVKQPFVHRCCGMLHAKKAIIIDICISGPPASLLSKSQSR